MVLLLDGIYVAAPPSSLPCVVNTFDHLQAFDENFEHMFLNHFFLLFKMMYITCPEIIIFWISGWLFLLSYPTGGV